MKEDRNFFARFGCMPAGVFRMGEPSRTDPGKSTNSYVGKLASTGHYHSIRRRRP
jgi:hypothetical protein